MRVNGALSCSLVVIAFGVVMQPPAAKARDCEELMGGACKGYWECAENKICTDVYYRNEIRCECLAKKKVPHEGVQPGMGEPQNQGAHETQPSMSGPKPHP